MNFAASIVLAVLALLAPHERPAPRPTPTPVLRLPLDLGPPGPSTPSATPLPPGERPAYLP